ncbi:MAG: hypothetical protein ABIS50_20660 [Luteolibacter sp.]|uniref:hypothetical protein n=1 Tax=Luteolibacter sp. TaxID=1962973 RepID=UPI003262FC88
MTQSTLIETWFTKPNPERGSLFRWGFLVVLLLLIAFNVVLAVVDLPMPALHWTRRFAVPLGLLMNHLAFYFPWRRPWLVVMRSLAYAGLIFAVILIFWIR